MKPILMLNFALLLMLGSYASNAQTNKKPGAKDISSTKVEVYYFHFTARCTTCRSVESNAKNAVESLYPDKVKNGEYTFKGLNLDDASNKALAEKLGIGGQTLLVVCGEKKIDLTSQGFLYANDPEKIKEEIKKAIEKVLKS